MFKTKFGGDLGGDVPGIFGSGRGRGGVLEMSGISGIPPDERE